MGIIKRGEGGISSIREYYNQLKSDAWQGNTRDIRAPHYGPTGKRKHLKGATVLGGLYILGQFRSRTPRIATAAKYALAPILGTTKLGKAANAAVDALRAGQQLGVLPNVILSNYADERHSCYPSEKHLGKICGISDRQIRRCLAWLAENNMLEIKHRKGTSNRYFLSVDTNVLTVRTRKSAYTKDIQKKKPQTNKIRSKNELAG